MKLSDFIGESTEYDKKAELEERRPKSWLKSVSAFANGKGGTLFFGIDDEGIVVGLKDARIASEKISEIIKVKMDPIPYVELGLYSENGKDIIILRVPSGSETPYYYVGEGNRTAYVRIGNESIPASSTDLKGLVLHGSGRTFDSLPSQWRYQDYSFSKLRSVYKNRTGKDLDESDFISFELMDKDGVLTNAGALLADDSPMRHSRLFCTRWHGLNKASGIMDALDDKEFSGSLISLLQNGEEFVKNNTKKRWKKTAEGRLEMPDIPERAALECIVNALIHRDYLDFSSEVHIDIFDDRMEIYSPGGMLDGSLVQDLDTDHVPSKRRNPIIADIFGRMNYMERRGSGFKKIKNDYHMAVNYRPEIEPRFYSNETSFWVILYNLNYNIAIDQGIIDSKIDLIEEEKVRISPGIDLIKDEKVAIGPEKESFEDERAVFNKRLNKTKFSAPTKKKIIILFESVGYSGIFGRSDIVRFTGTSLTSAGNLLNKMKEMGIIEQVRGYGKGKYQFKR